MPILVVGASGATGRLLVQELLNRGQRVKAVVRSPAALPDAIKNHDALSLVQADLLALSEQDLVQLPSGCTAAASCLGHTLSLKGIYGSPRRLVTDATRRLCEAIGRSQPRRPVRFVLMNTAGNSNRDLDEPVSFAQKCVLSLLRALLPPHPDNEQAAEYLRSKHSSEHSDIEWSVVRPDTLVNEQAVTEYDLHPSPTRSAIFNAGKTSRINVAHFMADLITEDKVWNEWQRRMPVIYNRGFS